MDAEKTKGLYGQKNSQKIYQSPEKRYVRRLLRQLHCLFSWNQAITFHTYREQVRNERGNNEKFI